MTKSIKPYIPFEIVYFEEFKTLEEAIKREKYFKSSRGREFLNKILAGIEGENVLKRLSSIFDANPDSPEGIKAELLVTLIDKYEKEHYPIALPEPITVIKEAMEM